MSGDKNKEMDNQKLYKGEKITFELGCRIGLGGNGSVHAIQVVEGSKWLKENWPQIDEKELVVKFFCRKGSWDCETAEIRYKRFCREIKTLREIRTSIPGIIPIIDFNLCQTCPHNNNSAWYIMPKAESYKAKPEVGQTLEDMLALAETIEQLHMRGITHRDIKSNNILQYKGRICLSDFGLVHDDNEDAENLTRIGESIGPYNILPPELEEIDAEKFRDSDYKPSDVYLFVKTVWIFLTGRRSGFRGEYRRDDPQIYFDNKIFKSETLEPIHIMMEYGTKRNPKDRIDIETCKTLLQKQLAIFDGCMDKNEMNKLIYDEQTKYFIENTKPDTRIYTEELSIRKYMEQSTNEYRFSITDGDKVINIDPTRIKRNADNIYEISFDFADRKLCHIILCVSEIQIDYLNNVIIKTKGEFDPHLSNINEYVELNQLSRMIYGKDRKLLLKGNYDIKVEARQEKV